MGIEVHGGPLMSMTEVKQHQWIDIDIHGLTDINIDVLMLIYLYIPHPEIEDIWD